MNWLNYQENWFIWHQILFSRQRWLFTQIISYYWRIYANEKQHNILYGFKSQYTSINWRLSKFEGCLNSRRENESKAFPQLTNEFLPPSKNISLKKDHTIYPMNQKDLCDYDPICIMSSGAMFDDIIMDTIKWNEFPHLTAETYFVLQILVLTSIFIFMYKGLTSSFYCKKLTYECLEISCE